jgi:hypothetical protein
LKNLRLNQADIQKKKTVGKSASQAEMVKAIKDLKLNLIVMSCENKEADEDIFKKINWFEDEEFRIRELKEIISFTSNKNAGKNNNVTINTNYRRLDAWKELYVEKGKDFKKEFLEASKEISDTTKPYLRYCNWKLPPGSYLSCNVPNSYWRLIKRQTLENWDNI